MHAVQPPDVLYDQHMVFDPDSIHIVSTAQAKHSFVKRNCNADVVNFTIILIADRRACTCRARLKQRLEAAQEGVSTEDGSSSVTSGLDEDQALQADIMMRRLVQVSLGFRV